MADQDFKLKPGVPGFHLGPDLKTWAVEKVPLDVASQAQFSGFLTIHGYRCTVFDTPGDEQWAQKSVNVPAEPEADQGQQQVASSIARIATRIAHIA